MYKVENKKVGAYISKRIESKFDSARKFCKVYLKAYNGTEPSECEIQNMANRLSQIKKGTKAIQIYDLPLFSELLGVSIEQMLSAGECGVPQNQRLTNYRVAQSHSRNEWRMYMEADGSPILSPDEYGKTVLEYAIEFSNYDFIKFLVDEEYIWFDSRQDKDYIMTFGAGTNIQRIPFVEYENSVFIREKGMNDLDYKLATEDQLRMYIISLAADHEDLEMLDRLRAREIPELYFKAHYISGQHPDFNAHYDKNMVSHISRSCDQVLDYFTEPFEVRDQIQYNDGSKRKHTFLFPYISELLDMMVVNNSPFLKNALEKSIAYNEETLKKLNVLIKRVIEERCIYNETDWKRQFAFFENGNIISFHAFYIIDENVVLQGIITNIVKVTKESKDSLINQLIHKLNVTYNSIRNIKTENDFDKGM